MHPRGGSAHPSLTSSAQARFSGRLPSPPCAGAEQDDTKGQLLGLSLQAPCRGSHGWPWELPLECLTPVAQLCPWRVPRRLWGVGPSWRRL